jgi:PEP-CTERM motif
MKKLLCAFSLSVAAASAQAASFVVDAFLHSYNGGAGTGLDTGLFFNAGDELSSSTSVHDLWSAGALPRWSNADGLGVTAITDLSGNLFATLGDESGQAPGTLIGTNFGLYTTAQGSFNYGTLVGQVGTGALFKIGTFLDDYVVTSTGTLKLYYWDSNAGDNANSVLAITVGALPVPEPETYAMLLAGFGLLGFVARRRSVRRVA